MASTPLHGKNSLAPTDVNSGLGTAQACTDGPEATLRYRLAFEKLMTGILSRLINVRSEEIDHGVNQTLADVGGFLHADRCYVFLFRHDAVLMDNTHEWCAAHIESHIDRLKALRIADYPSVACEVQRGKVAVIRRVADLGPDRAVEKAEFEREGIQSLVSVPMMYRGQVLGFLGLDSVQNECIFNDDSVALLSIAGECLASVLERKWYEEALRRERGLLRHLMDTSPSGIVRMDREGRFTFANEQAYQVLGLPRDDISLCSHDNPQWRIADFGGLPFDKGQLPFNLVKKTGRTVHDVRFSIMLAEGQRVLLSLSAAPLLDDSGRFDGVVATVEDVSERVRAEQALRESAAQVQHVQKLESLGVLAGGIAHDFNNLLMAILGNADLARLSLSAVSPAQSYLREIEMASRHAADLCRQMLAYAGKGHFVVAPLNLNELIQEMMRMLEVTISKRALLQLNLARDLPAIKADATQLRQVLLNLTTNAAEAITQTTGVITLTTGVKHCDRAYLTHAFPVDSAEEGSYVFLEVADSGCGMTPEVMARIFEPFFTTKFTGRGLGLAALRGIVKGHKGAIRLHSQPGQGTTIRVLFPALAEAAADTVDDDDPACEWRGSGTVLLVDDDPNVSSVTQHMLNLLGFKTLVLNDSRAALESFRRQDSLACVLLDLAMPHLSGEELYQQMRAVNPTVPIIICSGHNEQDVAQRFTQCGPDGVIQKPFQFQALRAKLRDVLKV